MTVFPAAGGRERLIDAVVDGASVQIRSESPPGKLADDIAGSPTASTCRPREVVDRLRHGTWLERLAALEHIDRALLEGEALPGEAEIREAVAGLVGACTAAHG